MNILFLLAEPGYLRIYGSTVRLLAERGHAVRLAYDRPERRGASEQPAADSGTNLGTVAGIPWERRRWTPLAEHVRLVADYLRYLDPRFANATHLRNRMARYLPARWKFLTRLKTLGHLQVRLLLKGLVMLDRAIPSDPAIERFLSSSRPDVLVLSPLVARGELGVRQSDTLKSAIRLGIPVALAVGSWDHLTSKGQIGIQPDLVIVWNDVQKAEAVELHGVPSRKIVVTGAQLFDHWFQKQPTMTRAEFFQQVGLYGEGPMLLYVGSSPGIAAPDSEIAFVRRWVAALRAADDSKLRNAAILIRPHPGNMDHWRRVDPSALPNVAIWPRTRPNVPMDSQDEANYFHSLYFSSAIVGINTSAMIEAAIVGRPVHTIRAPEFRHTQEGTLHFHYLLPDNGGFVRTADDFESHLRQLAESLAGGERVRSECAAFVRAFVRPHGIGQEATPMVADAIERLGREGVESGKGIPLALTPVTAGLGLVAWLLSIWPRGVRGSNRAPTRNAFSGESLSTPQKARE